MTSKNIGRYEIKGELGHGGMGTVYHAYDPQFKRDVGLKLLPHTLLHDPTFRGRFQQEAQTIASLEHPAIVPVYDMGEQDEQPYLVMRFMSGGSLDDRIRRGALTVAEVTPIFERVASALDEAHAKGIIHRDVKPANILFDQYDNACLADFGIARLVEGSSAFTGTGVIGTPAFMAPEMAEGRLSPLVDVYALGVSLFQALTGHLPYGGDTPVEILSAHLTEPIPSLRSLHPDLPAQAQRVIDQALAKDPSQRYASAGALASDLAGLLRPSTTVRAARAPARNRGRWLGIGAAALGSLALVGIVAATRLLAPPSALPPQAAAVLPAVSASPTPTTTASPTPSAIATPTPTASLTPTPTPTVIPIDSKNLQKLSLNQTLDFNANGMIRVAYAVWSPDRSKIVEYMDNGVVMWDARQWQTQWTLSTEDGYGLATEADNVGAVVWSPDGSLLAAPKGSVVVLLDPNSGEQLKTLTGLPTDVVAAAFSPDGARLTAAALDGSLMVWNVNSREKLRTLQGISKLTDSTKLGSDSGPAALSPDGSKLAIGALGAPGALDGSHQSYWIVDVDTDTMRAMAISWGGLWTECLAWSPDSTLLARGASGEITLLDGKTGKIARLLRSSSPSAYCEGAAFSPDGQILAVALKVDQALAPTIDLYDVKTGYLLRTLSSDKSGIAGALGVDFGAVAWSPDGSMLFAGRWQGGRSVPDTGSILVWGLAP